MTEAMNGSPNSPAPDYYNSGSTEASTDTALVIKRLEAVSYHLRGVCLTASQFELICEF
jgi:hypothetical protein